MKIIKKRINKLQLENLFPKNLKNILFFFNRKILEIEKNIKNTDLQYEINKEVEVGKWIDGKTIYKQTFSFTLNDIINKTFILPVRCETIIKNELIIENAPGFTNYTTHDGTFIRTIRSFPTIPPVTSTAPEHPAFVLIKSENSNSNTNPDSGKEALVTLYYTKL